MAKQADKQEKGQKGGKQGEVDKKVTDKDQTQKNRNTKDKK